MKKSSSKSQTFALALSMATTLLALRQNVLARKKSAPRILLAAILPLSSSPRGSRMVAKDDILFCPLMQCAAFFRAKTKMCSSIFIYFCSEAYFCIKKISRN